MATAAGLEADEVAAYRRDGFVVPRYRLPAERLVGLQRAMPRLLADNPEHADEPLICPHVPGSGAQRLSAGPVWRETATDPAIVGMAADLQGENLILWGSAVFYKPAREGRGTPWHRDGRYWPIEPLATTSVWIAIWDTTRENGCLRCIPGSHLSRRIGRHFTADRADMLIQETLAAEEYDESLAADIELEAGQMVLFDVFTIHVAGPNQGRQPRAGFALRFMPSSSLFRHDAAERREHRGNAHDTRPLILVRGRDLHGGNDFRRGHP
ncbi:MAG: phytanoyl-CoA dioxygenase family protein [Alphaproteobacteria bacterium]|nr:phytanoyl-CoA dioxygenase family protein [Alphaproteobacteria bacterium]